VIRSSALVPLCLRIIPILCILCILCPLPTFSTPTAGASEALRAIVLEPDQGPRDIVFEPDLVIESDEDESEFLIGRVSSVVVDSHGTIYVGDSQLVSVLKFSDSGEFLGKFGSEGPGPGEIMKHFTMGIDAHDRLAFAGVSGRVTLLDTEGNFLDEFLRDQPGWFTSSLQFDSKGELYTVSANMLTHQMIQEYSPKGEFLRSFGDTYAVGTNEDPRSEQTYASGKLAIAPADTLFYVQSTPYELRKYSCDGILLAKTNEGAGEFVPPHPKVDWTRSPIAVSFMGGATGIAIRPDALVVTTAFRRLEDDTEESMLCCYDSQLHLLGSKQLSGVLILRSCDSRGRIFVSSRGDVGPVITRYRLHLE
jgi:hypothetical protein